MEMGMGSEAWGWVVKLGSEAWGWVVKLGDG